jgi:hypothetical protein
MLDAQSRDPVAANTASHVQPWVPDISLIAKFRDDKGRNPMTARTGP